MTRIEARVTVEATAAGKAVDLLARQSGLAKARIKEAMQKGAVHLKAPGRGRRRLRRVTYVPAAGSVLELHYDPEVLALEPPAAECREDRCRFSVWCKPAGLLTQGTDYGDHCSLLRQAELHFTPPRPALPVHRLDREVAGLVLVAHDREGAARLSKMLAAGEIAKRYGVVVAGRPAAVGVSGIIEKELSGRRAVTEYTVVSYCDEADRSCLVVQIGTGRLHQIRRHLAGIGYPVEGDRRHGGPPRKDGGLSLVARELALIDPFTGDRLGYSCPEGA